jgi:hypothetical protein
MKNLIIYISTLIFVQILASYIAGGFYKLSVEGKAFSIMISSLIGGMLIIFRKFDL